MIDRPTAVPTLASTPSLDLRADLLRLVNGFAHPNASIVLDGTHTNRPAHQPGAVALLHLRWIGDPLAQMDTLEQYLDVLPVPTAAAVAFGPDILVGVVTDVPTAEELEDRDDPVMWLLLPLGVRDRPRPDRRGQPDRRPRHPRRSHPRFRRHPRPGGNSRGAAVHPALPTPRHPTQAVQRPRAAPLQRAGLPALVRQPLPDLRPRRLARRCAPDPAGKRLKPGTRPAPPIGTTRLTTITSNGRS